MSLSTEAAIALIALFITIAQVAIVLVYKHYRRLRHNLARLPEQARQQGEKVYQYSTSSVRTCSLNAHSIASSVTPPLLPIHRHDLHVTPTHRSVLMSGAYTMTTVSSFTVPDTLRVA